MPKRIVYLDLVKLFTIYLVILGHVIAMMVNGYSVGGRLYAFIYSFHMPLFVLLSGYFVSSRLEEMPIVDLIMKRGRQLLLPSITCTLICCVYLWLTKEHPNCRDEMIGNSWFLKTLFVYYFLFGLLKRLPIDDWGLCVVSCMALFMIPGCSSLQVNLLFPYFWGGYLLRKYSILERVCFSWRYALVVVSLFGVAYYLQRHWDVPNYIAINSCSLQTDWHLILFRYLVAFSGSLSVITLVSVIYKYLEGGSFINRLSCYGQWTLGIYVLQTILVINIFPDIIVWYVESELLLDVVVAPLLSMGFLVLCIWLIHWLPKSKTADLLMFGGQYYKG